MPSQLTSRLSHIGSSSREREIKVNVYFSIRRCTYPSTSIFRTSVPPFIARQAIYGLYLCDQRAKVPGLTSIACLTYFKFGSVIEASY